MKTNEADFKKVVGYGVFLWVLIFVIVSTMVAFDIYSLSGMEFVVSVIAGLISYILAGYAKPRNLVQALMYGFLWAVIGIVLDSLVTMRFNPLILQSASLWLSYALVILMPALRVKK